MTNIKNLITSICILFAVVSCKPTADRDLASGIWRATLKTESGAEIPFNFEVTDSAERKNIYIINGRDRFKVDEISIKNDSLTILLPLFDSEIRAVIRKNNSITGQWIKHLANKDVSMIFQAEPGAAWRFFKVNKQSDLKVAGRWSVTFRSQNKKDTTVAVGEFRQDGSKVFGTFLTSTGDYRFLEGTIADNNLYLSSFDGGNAYLFTAKLRDSITIVDGKFYSGYSSIQDWSARKDPKAILPDAYSLTGLKAGYDKINFSFPDLNGEKVSLSDDKFRNKVVLVQFLGSWCPNCMDETAYLVPFYNKFKAQGLEIIGLAYERTADFERSRKNVERLKQRFNIPYDLLLTGFTNDKNEVAKSIPMLANFVAFPTLIILDKNGKVRKIHTGFSGPGTGEHYTAFTKEFEASIKALLQE